MFVGLCDKRARMTMNFGAISMKRVSPFFFYSRQSQKRYVLSYISCASVAFRGTAVINTYISTTLLRIEKIYNDVTHLELFEIAAAMMSK